MKEALLLTGYIVANLVCFYFATKDFGGLIEDHFRAAFGLRLKHFK